MWKNSDGQIGARLTFVSRDNMVRMSDLRYAARMLAKKPGFTLVTAGLLSIGIGASSLMFTAFESVWLRPLPVRHPEELVRMVQKTPQLGTRSYFIYPYYRALAEHSTTLAGVFGEYEMLVAMNEPLPAEQIRLHLATPEFFQELGAAALYGRALSPDDAKEAPGSVPAVLSYGFWQRRFHSDRAALGGTISLHGHPFTIVGVMPREFNGVSMDNAPDVRVPLRALPLLAEPGAEAKNGTSPLDDVQLDLGGRLRPGVTRERAQAECLAIWRSTIEDWYGHRPDFGPQSAQSELSRGMELDPLEHGVSVLRDKFGGALELLTISVGLLLLLVCANVAGLLLAGAAARRNEVSVRLALGATRTRLVRQMLVESLLLTALGAAGGWMLAWISAPLLVRALPPIRDLATARMTLSLDFTPDGRVIAVSLAAALLTAVLFGLAPALSASRISLDSVLRGVRSSRGWGGQRALVMVQVALCTLLLAGAGLLVRTLEQLRNLDPGFDSEHVVTFTAYPNLSAYTDAQSKSFWQALAARVREIPGVVSVAAASRPVMRGSGVKSTIAPTGQKATRADFLNTSMNWISPEYFETMGIHMLEGRVFTSADLKAPKPSPVIVNEAFVRRFFPEGKAVGRRFGNGMGVTVGADFEIVGVVSDAKYRSLREPMTPIYYQVSDTNLSVLCVKTRAAPESVIQPVRAALAGLDAALPFTEIHTLAEEVDASAAPERLTAALATVFGLFATLLAAVGIYGLLAFSVEQRRREIGIRMALGATASDVGGMLGLQAGGIVGCGVIVGLGGALLAGRWIGSLLYGVAPADAQSLSWAVVLVALVSAAATAIPAVRAIRVEPASALRQE
jgi:predicted permease